MSVLLLWKRSGDFNAVLLRSALAGPTSWEADVGLGAFICSRMPPKCPGSQPLPLYLSTTTISQCSCGKGCQQEFYLGFDAMHYIKVHFAYCFICQVLL